jgi:dienelactone hydrolase
LPASNPAPKAAVIVLPEVFGWAGRLKGICDSLAKEGYLAIMPDCHRGDTANGKADVVSWVSTFPWEGRVKEDFSALFSHLSSLGVTRVCSIGFCWGSWANSKAASEGLALACCVGAHPSVKLEEFAFKADQAALLRKVGCPMLLLLASNDDPKLKKDGELGSIVVGAGGEVVEFADMTHGWMSRGDIGDEAVKRDVLKGFDLALPFLKKHCPV